jgi:aminopeptidase C
MKKIEIIIIALCAIAAPAAAQESLQPKTTAQEAKQFTIRKSLPITSVKNQYRSGTCWAFGTLGFVESEILRKTGKSVDLCEMFVVNKDYMDNAEHYVRMHGFSQISEGGSCDDVLDVISCYGICPEDAMPAPGSLVGDTLANFTRFFPELTAVVRRAIVPDSIDANDLVAAQKAATTIGTAPRNGWRDSVQAVIDRNIGRCPEIFTYQGRTYTPKSFAAELGINAAEYVSLTSFIHHPFRQWCVIEAPYKWRLKPSYNIPVGELIGAIDRAIDAGYTVAWGGDVSWGLTREGTCDLADSLRPECPFDEDPKLWQQARQEQWDDWRMTYDHVMLIYGRATDQEGRPYYLVKNTWGAVGPYRGTWYMSRDYMAINTTYIFLNRAALPKQLRKAVGNN